MSDTGVLAIGASAGGVEALREVAAGLPADLPACVLVTVHIGEHASSRLPEILTRAGRLPAVHAQDGQPLRPGNIYVAPPGTHLLAAGGVARLSAGPTVNGHRPAIDVMFTSAARWADGHTVAVVLSGLLDDGAVGAALVTRSGGRVLVQDPEQALFDSMPKAALVAAPDARVVTAAKVGPRVCELLTELHTSLPTGGDHRMDMQQSMAESGDTDWLASDETSLTRMSCPDCFGALAQIRLPTITFYRCHTGHQFAPQTLEACQRHNAETTLWRAVSVLEEHAAHARHLAHHEHVDTSSAQDYRHHAQRSAQIARDLRATLIALPPTSGDVAGSG